MALKAYLVRESEEWEHTSHSFSHTFSYMDNLSDDNNGIKNDYEGNEILPISGILIYP